VGGQAGPEVDEFALIDLEPADPAGAAAGGAVDFFAVVPDTLQGEDFSLARLGIWALGDRVPLGAAGDEERDAAIAGQGLTAWSLVTACATGPVLLGPRPATFEALAAALGFDGLAATLTLAPTTAHSAVRRSRPGDVARGGFVVGAEAGTTAVTGGDGIARPIRAVTPRPTATIASTIAALPGALQFEARAALLLTHAFDPLSSVTVVIPASPQPGQILASTLAQIPPQRHAPFSQVVGALLMVAAPARAGLRSDRQILHTRGEWLTDLLHRARVWTVHDVRTNMATIRDTVHPGTHPGIARILDSEAVRGYSARGPSPRRPGEIVPLREIGRDFLNGTRTENDLIAGIFAPNARITAANLVQVLGAQPHLARRLGEINSDDRRRVTRVPATGRSRMDTRSGGDGDSGDGQDDGQGGSTEE
jgi:hypothetical protein